MWNCFKSNKVMAQDEPYLIPSPNLPPIEAKKLAEDNKSVAGSAMAKPKTAEARGKKVVRFKLEEDEDSAVGGGGVIGGISDGGAGDEVMRIKVVMSQKELKQILKERENGSCTLEELIAELKVKGRTAISDAGIDGSRRPALECIPDSRSPLKSLSLS